MKANYLETKSIPLPRHNGTLGDLDTPERAREWVSQLRQKSWFKNCEVRVTADPLERVALED